MNLAQGLPFPPITPANWLACMAVNIVIPGVMEICSVSCESHGSLDMSGSPCNLHTECRKIRIILSSQSLLERKLVQVSFEKTVIFIHFQAIMVPVFASFGSS